MINSSTCFNETPTCFGLYTTVICDKQLSLHRNLRNFIVLSLVCFDGYFECVVRIVVSNPQMRTLFT